MKKLFVHLLALVTVMAVVSCDDKDNPEPIVEPVAGPTITWKSNPNFEDMNITDAMDVKIQVDAPAGIKTFKIAVKSEVLNGKGITELDLIEPGDGMKETVEMILGGAGSPLDKTSCSLDLSKLVLMINTLTDEESDHTFTLTVTDKNDSTATRTAKFHRVAVPKPDKTTLKVSMFTKFNVKSIEGNIVTFFDKLDNTVPDNPITAYFTYTELMNMGLTGSDGSEILYDAEGNKYRLPTSGELNLLVPTMEWQNGFRGALFPVWNDSIRNTIADEASTDGWFETIYLKNSPDNSPDEITHAGETDGEYCIVGKSWLKRGVTTETFYDEMGRVFNLAPVYGLRFQGTSQYAAYRWEYCKIDNDEKERYLSIKIKALGKDDVTIDDVDDESFWTDGCIEFTFPASGHYSKWNENTPTSKNISDRGMSGYCWSSSNWNAEYLTTSRMSFNDQVANTNTYTLNVLGGRFPLRLVRVMD